MQEEPLYLSEEEVLQIVEVLDCPSVELKMDVGDELYRLISEYGLRYIEKDDYFKIGFHKLLENSLLKPLKDETGQTYFSFDENT